MPGPSATQLAVLSKVSIGMWTAKKGQAIWFLIVPRRQLLVIVVEDDVINDSLQKRRRSFAAPNVIFHMVGSQSPFNSAVFTQGGCAFAFEVAYDTNISGIDYTNSLVRDGRLVLEAHHVKKRDFDTVESAFAYYGGADGEATRASLEALSAGYYNNYYGNNNNSLSNLPTEPQSYQGLCSASSPSDTPLEPLSTAKHQQLSSPSQHNNRNGNSNDKRGARTNLLTRLSNSLSSLSLTTSKSHDLTSSSPGRPPPSPPPPTAPLTTTTTIRCVPSSPSVIIAPFHEPERSQGNGGAGSTPTSRLFSKPLRGGDDVTIKKQSGPETLLRLSQSTADILGTPIKPAPPATIYDFRLITVYWKDSQFPEVLRPVIEGNEHLLRMYESGLPTWAVIFPRAGLPYRPWLRSLTWFLFYTFSFLSLAIGFYDLYKTLPGLQALLSRVVAGLWLPPAVVLQWIEEHSRIRLSILLTYLFGKSEMLGYVIAVVRPPVLALWTTIASPILIIIRTLSDFTHNVLLPPCQSIFYSLCILPFSWIGSLFTALTTSTTPAAASPAWLLHIIPGDVMVGLRTSLGTATRSAQSVWRSMNQMIGAFSRHRLTMSRRAGRWRRRLQLRIIGLLWLLLSFAKECLRWILSKRYYILNLTKRRVERQENVTAWSTPHRVNNPPSVKPREPSPEIIPAASDPNYDDDVFENVMTREIEREDTPILFDSPKKYK